VDPKTYSTSDDGVDPTIANLAPAADDIVVGTIVDIGDPEWNSVDGSDPGEPRSADQVIRPVTIRVNAARETPEVSEMLVLAPGGTIGCQTFVLLGFPELRPGQQYAMFLTHAGVNDGSTALATFEIWPVADSVVDTAREGAVPLDEFLARIGAAPAR